MRRESVDVPDAVRLELFAQGDTGELEFRQVARIRRDLPRVHIATAGLGLTESLPGRVEDNERRINRDHIARLESGENPLEHCGCSARPVGIDDVSVLAQQHEPGLVRGFRRGFGPPGQIDSDVTAHCAPSSRCNRVCPRGLGIHRAVTRR